MPRKTAPATKPGRKTAPATKPGRKTAGGGKKAAAKTAKSSS